MDKLSCQNMKQLSIEQQAIQRALPEILYINDIVKLWTNDTEGQASIKKAMDEDIKEKVLLIDQSSKEDNLKINRTDFKRWLTKLHKKPINKCFHENCLLANWYADKTIHTDNSLSFYEAYRELEIRLANLSYTEFGLFVFNSNIRIFEKRPDNNENLKQLSGSWELNEVGIADTISNDITPLNLTLSKFRYSKEDIDRLTPSYRYICFDDACKEIAYFANKPEQEIKQFLIQKAEYESTSPFHPYCGYAHSEYENLWPDSAYPDYIVSQILRDDFGISEYEYAFDIEARLSELKAKGNSDDEVNRMRKVLDRRLESSASLIEKRNAIAEIASLRLGVDEYHKYADKILNNPISIMPDSPHHADRVMRYVWLHELEAEYKRMYKTTWCPERDEKLKQINERIDEINRQLGVLGNLIDAPNEQNDIDPTKNKPRKKLKPLVRETNEALLLIYELLAKHNITYFDEMPAPKAWGLIISKKFTSSYIKSLPETSNGKIILNGGDKLNKPDFFEKYRKRFK